MLSHHKVDENQHDLRIYAQDSSRGDSQDSLPLQLNSIDPVSILVRNSSGEASEEHFEEKIMLFENENSSMNIGNIDDTRKNTTLKKSSATAVPCPLKRTPSSSMEKYDVHKPPQKLYAISVDRRSGPVKGSPHRNPPPMSELNFFPIKSLNPFQIDDIGKKNESITREFEKERRQKKNRERMKKYREEEIEEKKNLRRKREREARAEKRKEVKKGKKRIQQSTIEERRERKKKRKKLRRERESEEDKNQRRRKDRERKREKREKERRLKELLEPKVEKYLEEEFAENDETRKKTGRITCESGQEARKKKNRERMQKKREEEKEDEKNLRRRREREARKEKREKENRLKENLFL